MTYVDTYVRPPSPAYAYALVDSEDWVICANVLLLICFFHYFEELSIFVTGFFLPKELLGTT